MRLRYWTAVAAVACVVVGVTLRDAPEPAPPSDAPVQDRDDTTVRDTLLLEPAPGGPFASIVRPGDGTPTAEPPVIWSGAVAVGESLDILLARAGLDVAARAEVSRALGSEFDLRRLQPGHRLALEMSEDGTPHKAMLEIDDGVRVEAVFGASASVRLVPPALETVHLAGETEIGSSIYAALEAAGIPTRFATDLELIFAGTLDLRRALVGGEYLRLSWRENRLGARTIGEPVIDFAELSVGDDRYEVLWPGDDARRSRILRNGDLVLLFDQPISGARLSSAFGPRQHPLHGTVRMHNGVDFAADIGAAIHAMKAGRVAFAGPRPGYGLMVEIDHGNGIRTVYAHLSAMDEAIAVGRSVAAGAQVGLVGSTGTSTAPHVHYEIVVADSPVPPLTDAHLLDPARETTEDATPHIEQARQDLARLLASRAPGAPRLSQSRAGVRGRGRRSRAGRGAASSPRAAPGAARGLAGAGVGHHGMA